MKAEKRKRRENRHHVRVKVTTAGMRVALAVVRMKAVLDELPYTTQHRQALEILGRLTD